MKVGEEAHAEESTEDSPVELPEEGQLGLALHHKATVGEQDQDDSEEEREEEGVEVEAGGDLCGEEEDFAPENPVLLLGVSVHHREDQEGDVVDQCKECTGGDTHQEAEGGSGWHKKAIY